MWPRRVSPMRRGWGFRCLSSPAGTVTDGANSETLAWAAGLSAAMASVFGATHVALVGRIFAARRMVNADHVGKCRFGFKIASDRNVGKHGRFGSDKGERNERDAYGESCQ